MILYSLYFWQPQQLSLPYVLLAKHLENKMKKLVCHSFTTKRITSEWIEIDARQVIKHWLKAYRMSHNRGIVTEPMVTIDVEDEFQQPLKAGIFFEPTDCQACTYTIVRCYKINIRPLDNENKIKMPFNWYLI